MSSGTAELKAALRPGQSEEEFHAEQLAEGVSSNAFLALLFAQHSGFAKQTEMSALAEATRKAVERTKLGGTEQADALLTSQAMALNAVFLEMSRRAALNMGEHLGAMETYMRLALKAQSQCRATLESLAEIRNPRAVAFVRQANIAGGHQQINNGPGTTDEATQPARAGGKRRPNELLEEVADAQWLDLGAAPKAVPRNSDMASMGTGNRPAQRRRKGKGG